jgi:hypothetical protein
MSHRFGLSCFRWRLRTGSCSTSLSVCGSQRSGVGGWRCRAEGSGCTVSSSSQLNGPVLMPRASMSQCTYISGVPSRAWYTRSTVALNQAAGVVSSE